MVLAPCPGLSRQRATVGSGRVLMWRGGTIWVSRATGLVQPHAHHAIQITLSPGGPIRLRSTSEPTWLDLNASIVMPDRTHQFDGRGQDIVMVFVEPESVVGRALIARFDDADLAAIDDRAVLGHARALLAAYEADADDRVIVDGAMGIVDLLAQTTAEPGAVDPRITRVLEWIGDRLDTPIALGQAAAIAHLSPSRFRHLFVAQIGISFRGYLLWARVRNAMVRGMAGDSWTVAAQASGFADSAHFSRTCRRMFGIAPTMLDRAG